MIRYSNMNYKLHLLQNDGFSLNSSTYIYFDFCTKFNSKNSYSALIIQYLKCCIATVSK